jgi:hypothetical protein
MRKKITILVLIILFVIICYVGYAIAMFRIYSHRNGITNYKLLLEVFKEKEKCRIDSSILKFKGSVGKDDVIFNYIYSKDYYILIWKFLNNRGQNLDNIKINEGIDLNNINFYYGEIINKNLYYLPELNIKLGFSLKNTINININKNSAILRTFQYENYKGFYGIINEISFNDEKNKPQALLSYRSGHEPTILLFYTTPNNFYIIVINSKKQFDESILKILQLN